MRKAKRQKEKILVANNLLGREGFVAEKLGTSISVILPAVVNRFIQKDTYSVILTGVNEREKINVEAG